MILGVHHPALAVPDMQRALVLYERAMERGADNASADLERTRGILKIPR